MDDEATYYVVDEDRAAVVAGPFDDQEDASDDASDRTPGHIVASKRVLDMIEMSSEQTLRWENTEDDVDIVTDGGVVQETGRPDEVPAYWNELTPAGKQIYLEEDATKNEALILVVHELGLDVDTSDIDTSTSLIHSEWLARVLGELLAVDEVVDRHSDVVDIKTTNGQRDGDDDAREDVTEDDAGDDTPEKAVGETDVEEDVPERAGVEDLRDRVDGEDTSGEWIREAFGDVNNLGGSVISRLEDAGYTHVHDLKEATVEELQENVQYVGESKANRLVSLASGDVTDGKTEDEEEERSNDTETGKGDSVDGTADFEGLDTPTWLDESSFYQAAKMSEDLADLESTLGWDEGHEPLAKLVEATGVDVEVSI